MKKKILPVLVVMALITLVLIGVGISALVEKYTPSKEVMDLQEYYNLSSEDQIAIILDHEMMEDHAKLINGNIYLDYHFVHDNINARFYWDANENILLYATATELISAEADSSSYLVTKSSTDFGRPIVKATPDSAFIDLEFVKLYSDVAYSYVENPNRLILTTNWGDVETATIKNDTQVRVLGGIKSPILAQLSKKTKVTVLETMDKWAKVMTEDGIIGYVQAKRLSSYATETLTSDYVPETFTHITKDFEICMAWHQVMSRSANSEVSSVLANTKGINVISPTWFYLNDNKGNIEDHASSDYVSYCHQQGVEVWALVNNIDNPDVDTTHVLTHTSLRHNLVNQIVSVAIQYNLDGINLDFEALNGPEVGDAYIQFVRELSIKCENNGIVLSVDNYVPAAYTAFYNRAEQALFADYVIIMGYDEHYAGSEAGSVASIGWVEEGVINTLEEVPAKQVILGMPFYTRVWTLTPEDGATSDEDDESELIYKTTSKAYGMSSAYNFIEDRGSEPVWSEEDGQYYAECYEGDVIHKVWLEDSSSCEKRLELLDKYGLAGASFWKLKFEQESIWNTIIKYIDQE